MSTIAALGYSSSAQAISFKITSGVPSLNGQTNQGAFSEFSKLKETTTIDFNSGSVPTTGFAKYSFENNTGASSVRSDQWAPAGSTGE
ncbi:MAG: PEP-CTERM sorting domain-containing protein, partial [Phormidesmis sp. CAN_BIN44]|nr:PEP-CTERM sorting domain-containing protein [Phormidesmis sp. CAN_BIN44]